MRQSQLEKLQVFRHSRSAVVENSRENGYSSYKLHITHAPIEDDVVLSFERSDVYMFCRLLENLFQVDLLDVKHFFNVKKNQNINPFLLIRFVCKYQIIAKNMFRLCSIVIFKKILIYQYKCLNICYYTSKMVIRKTHNLFNDVDY